jgi:DNA repair photolyase
MNHKAVIKGRGTGLNPANRFELIFTEPDPDWDPALNRHPKTEVYRDTTKRIISFNESPDIGFSASLNPYRGCEHGCVYCYARPGHEYFGLSCGVDFESKIFAKETAPDLLRKELAHKRWQPQVIVMSGVTDPYQPIERKMTITRRCLEVLLEFRNPVAIITKNHLITRDLDILEPLNEFRCVAVNISVTTLDKKLARILEPRASQPHDRLQAIEELSRKNIPVNVMVAPIIPALNDQEIPAILKTVAEAGALSAAYVCLRLPYANKDLFENWLDNHFPDRKIKILNRIRSMRGGKLYDAQWGRRMRGEGVFAEQINQFFKVNCRRCGLNEKRFNLSIDFFQNPHNQKQYTLF